MSPSTEGRGNKLTGAQLAVGIDSQSVAVGLVRMRSLPAGVPRGSLPRVRIAVPVARSHALVYTIW